MKISIEINIVGDGRTFLNFWDHHNGNDVCCQVCGDRLFISNYDENGDELPETEISFFDFLQKVEAANSDNFI